MIEYLLLSATAFGCGYLLKRVIGKTTVEVVKEKEVERIVAVGDSVVDVYKIAVPEPPSARHYVLYGGEDTGYLKALSQWDTKWKRYENTYFLSAEAAFAGVSGGVSVVKQRAVLASDGNAYLLNANLVITVEDK